MSYSLDDQEPQEAASGLYISGWLKTTLLDFPGKVASSIFLGGCNFRCPYCHNPELVLPQSIKNNPPLDPEEIFSYVKNETDAQKISMAEWFRDSALLKIQMDSQGNRKEEITHD